MAIAKIRGPVSLAPWIASIALYVARPEIRGRDASKFKIKGIAYLEDSWRSIEFD